MLVREKSKPGTHPPEIPLGVYRVSKRALVMFRLMFLAHFSPLIFKKNGISAVVGSQNLK